MALALSHCFSFFVNLSNNSPEHNIWYVTIDYTIFITKKIKTKKKSYNTCFRDSYPKAPKSQYSWISFWYCPMITNNTIKATTMNGKNPSEKHPLKLRQHPLERGGDRETPVEDRHLTNITRVIDMARTAKWVLSFVDSTLNSKEKSHGTSKRIKVTTTRSKIGNGKGSRANMSKMVEILLLVVWIAIDNAVLEECSGCEESFLGFHEMKIHKGIGQLSEILRRTHKDGYNFCLKCARPRVCFWNCGKLQKICFWNKKDYLKK